MAAMSGHASMVDGERGRLDLRPAIVGDVVAGHPRRALAGGHEAAHDVDPVADPAGADLGPLERARLERLPATRGPGGCGAAERDAEDRRCRCHGDSDRADPAHDASMTATLLQFV
jgi:hypothetical protein